MYNPNAGSTAILLPFTISIPRLVPTSVNCTRLGLVVAILLTHAKLFVPSNQTPEVSASFASAACTMSPFFNKSGNCGQSAKRLSE